MASILSRPQCVKNEDDNANDAKDVDDDFEIFPTPDGYSFCYIYQNIFS